MDINTYLEILKKAERQYKFTIAIYLTCTGTEKNFVQYYDTFIFGSHTYKYNELYLNVADEKIACATLEYSTTYIIAVQIDTILEKFVPERFNHSDSELKNAALIVRQIRNAFAHDPFNPVWSIKQPEAQNKILEIKNIISLDTSKINGKMVDRIDYGGPLSILRLSEFIRKRLGH